MTRLFLEIKNITLCAEPSLFILFYFLCKNLLFLCAEHHYPCCYSVVWRRSFGLDRSRGEARERSFLVGGRCRWRSGHGAGLGWTRPPALPCPLCGRPAEMRRSAAGTCCCCCCWCWLRLATRWARLCYSFGVRTDDDFVVVVVGGGGGGVG